MRAQRWWIGFVGLFVVGLLAGLALYGERSIDTMSTPDHALNSFVQDQGILYVRIEEHQAQRGLSIALGGGQMRPLTTIHEFWLDAQNPWRIRRVTSELLEDGPHLIFADGSDGNTGWWSVDWAKGQSAPERGEGRYPLLEQSKTELSFDVWIRGFWRDGQTWLNRLHDGKAMQVGEAEQGRWGHVLLLQANEAGYVVTATVRAETPNILVEKITVDSNGILQKAQRITNWDWLDPTQLGDDFWMNPPADVPIGSGALKP